ncbi:MAG: hypothetical protein V1911_04005 [Candidatus Micrarchaeota archaeon]
MREYEKMLLLMGGMIALVIILTFVKIPSFDSGKDVNFEIVNQKAWTAELPEAGKCLVSLNATIINKGTEQADNVIFRMVSYNSLGAQAAYKDFSIGNVGGGLSYEFSEYFEESCDNVKNAEVIVSSWD